MSIYTAIFFYKESSKDTNQLGKLDKAIGMGLAFLFLYGFAGFLVYAFISYTISRGGIGIWSGFLSFEILFAVIPAIPISVYRKRDYSAVLWIQTKSLFITLLGIIALFAVSMILIVPGIFLGYLAGKLPSWLQILVFFAIYGRISLWYHIKDGMMYDKYRRKK